MSHTSYKGIDKKIRQREDEEYERNREIDLKHEAQEQAEKDRKQQLKIEEIRAKALVDAMNGREYQSGGSQGLNTYQRATLRGLDEDDRKSMEGAE